MKQLNRALSYAALAGLIVACGQDTDAPSVEQMSTAETTRGYAGRGVDNSWPPLAEGAVALAPDLSASNYYLVVDGSGSMDSAGCSDGQQKLKVAKAALSAFIDKITGNANIGVFAFDRNGIGELAPLRGTSKDAARGAVAAMAAGGGTPLSEAIREGYEALTTQAAAQLGYGEYHLVVVTDGEASRGFAPDTNVQRIVESSPIVLHTIGFCIDADHSLNQPGLTLYRAANDPEALAVGLEAVLAEAPDFTVASFPEQG